MARYGVRKQSVSPAIGINSCFGASFKVRSSPFSATISSCYIGIDFRTCLDTDIAFDLCNTFFSTYNSYCFCTCVSASTDPHTTGKTGPTANGNAEERTNDVLDAATIADELQIQKKNSGLWTITAYLSTTCSRKS